MTDSNPTIAAAQGINTANQSQSGAALIVQQYANSVNQQPNVDFSGEPTLKQYETQINTGLATAQGHANNYLNNIQPTIITNITNIANYYALHNAISIAVPKGSSNATWIKALMALQGQSTKYKTAANGVVSSLQTLINGLDVDVASFATTVSELNSAVNGDNGVLATDKKELDSIQSNIDGAIAGTVVSALAIAGGVFIVAVGGVTDFVTAGASTPLVVGGIAVVAGGVAGETASAIALEKLNNQKAALLQQEAKLSAEVKLAMGISSGYSSLKGNAQNAVTAATAMENAWIFLSSGLGNLITDLKNGTTNDGVLQTLFLSAANTAVQAVITDTQTIQAQMTGVTIVPVAKDQNVGQAIVGATQSAAKALIKSGNDNPEIARYRYQI